MSQYTLTIKQIVENNVNIFDFEYPLEVLSKEYFQEMFINHFYFREIGLETVGRFKFHLKEKLNLILPYYNKLLYSQSLEQRILDNYDVTETFKRDVTSTNINNSSSENINLYSDTPKRKIDIESVDYVSNINKDKANLNNTTNGNNKEVWERTMKGNIGVQTDADAIKKFEGSIRNILLEIFDELEVLFMGIY